MYYEQRWTIGIKFGINTIVKKLILELIIFQGINLGINSELIPM
jgi:hypothetical protein